MKDVEKSIALVVALLFLSGLVGICGMLGCSVQGPKVEDPATFQLVGEQDGAKVYLVKQGFYRFYLVKSGEHVAVTDMR